MKSESTAKRDGHIYVLTSPRCEHVKIGGTDHAPIKRIKEINCSEPYKSLGPWTLHDFRQVTDWRKVECALHYIFRESQVKDIVGQRELFAVPPSLASTRLSEIDDSLVLRKPKIDRMFQDQEFSSFLMKLFGITGLMNWLDQQGAWSFSLFPSTNGGRYYTLNIGPHEVSFSTSKSQQGVPAHMILMDRLILDFPDVRGWLKSKKGQVNHDQYASALHRSTSVFFEGNFNIAIEFLNLTGVRRAMIAYWTEALIDLQEKSASSAYARHHNWNAVAELKYRLIGVNKYT